MENISAFRSGICRIAEIFSPQKKTLIRYPGKNNQFSAKNDSVYQTIWIIDQAPRFMGPDLDPY